jgi:hypothetical protein
LLMLYTAFLFLRTFVLIHDLNLNWAFLLVGWD